MGFKSTVMYRKGELGEKLVDELLLNNGNFIPYAPVMENAHVFDRLIASKNKKSLMVVEIKAINARDHYPDTGISINHYLEYKHIEEKYNLDVWILFVDAKKKMIYGNTLKKLETQTEVLVKDKGIVLNYPVKQKNFTAIGKEIIYFPLVNMKDIVPLEDEHVAELNENSNKGYKNDLSWKQGWYEYQQERL